MNDEGAIAFKEYEIDEHFNYNNKEFVCLEVPLNEPIIISCNDLGCAFSKEYCDFLLCNAEDRKDYKSVYFKEVTE